MASIFTLPLELRRQIYRLILVRPCKFNLDHLESCPESPRYTPTIWYPRTLNELSGCYICSAPYQATPSS
ncbi:hypothetical protein BJY04DRAFT_198261 [Aspergillus karnatakaensis]|uniref:uncharacterized protein n=1 Tax=Aspergillus karnatakaensis TaxID=1810916 RepID=UPI003CCE2995